MECDLLDDTLRDTRATHREVISHSSSSAFFNFASFSIARLPNDTSTTVPFNAQWPLLSSASSAATTPISADDVERAFLLSLYEHSEKQEIGRGSLLVVKHLDALMRKNDCASINLAMRQAYVGKLDPEIAFAFLTITAPVRKQLDQEVRSSFMAQTRQRLLETRTPAYVDELLEQFK